MAMTTDKAAAHLELWWSFALAAIPFTAAVSSVLWLVQRIGQWRVRSGTLAPAEHPLDIFSWPLEGLLNVTMGLLLAILFLSLLVAFRAWRSGYQTVRSVIDVGVWAAAAILLAVGWPWAGLAVLLGLWALRAIATAVLRIEPHEDREPVRHEHQGRE